MIERNDSRRAQPGGWLRADDILRAPKCGRGRGSPDGDDGTSFLEIIVTITLAGIVVLALLAAVRTSVTASSIVYEGGRLETALLNVSDQIRRATPACDYSGVTTAPGWDGTVTIESIENIKDASVRTDDSVTDWSPCSLPVLVGDVQRVTIRATTADGDLSRTMVVMKSDVG